jgi:hypothetical protein
MKRGFFRVRRLDDLRNSIEHPLVGDHPRQLLVVIDLGVKFDASLTHPTRAVLPSESCLFRSANALGRPTVPRRNETEILARFRPKTKNCD